MWYEAKKKYICICKSSILLQKNKMNLINQPVKASFCLCSSSLSILKSSFVETLFQHVCFWSFFGLGIFSLIGVSLVGYFYWSMLHIPVKNSCANEEIGDCSHDQTQRSHILLLHNNSTEENQSFADTLLFLKASKSCLNTCPSILLDVLTVAGDITEEY